jgi:valyl-tRNA synthetase
MAITKARPLIVEKLKQKGLLSKIEERYVHNTATNSRGGGLIEPQIKEQWFVAVNKKFTISDSKINGVPSGAETTLKELMRKVVENGPLDKARGKQIEIIPERFVKIYFHWINNLRDWCISRQIWYGHRVPVWYCGGASEPTELEWGWHEDVMPQVLAGKTTTYRLRDHGLKIGDRVAFRNSQTGMIFGHGTITGIKETTVGKVPLDDTAHGATYKNREELIDAFKRRNPQRTVTGDTPAFLYSYTFSPQDPDEICGKVIVAIDAPTKCPKCGSTNLVQDSDTLDTWFSSGLWTFSTLGWPFDAAQGKPTEDFKTYHPTSVLETAYDILFFWVARMILMTGCLLGDVPFRKVYLHGIVRDAQGRKMSKSLGNGIDPLEMADKYGADATRLSLVIGTGAGNDQNLSEDKIRGYRNFGTKIWNASRFVLLNKPRTNADLTPTNAEKIAKEESPRMSAYSPRESAYMAEFARVKKEVTGHLERFEFHLAGEKAYHYFWHTFADEVIEAEKPHLKDGTPEEKAAAYHVLETLLIDSLKLLHPFMPFVTEAVYQKIRLGELLMVEKW